MGDQVDNDDNDDDDGQVNKSCSSGMTAAPCSIGKPNDSALPNPKSAKRSLK